MNSKIKYDYIVPIGFFCSPAIELKRLGYRSQALPFDWVICDLSSIGKLIESNFSDLFNISYLKNDKKNHAVIQHTVYKFTFVHDFITDKNIEEQIDQVKEKYTRRIERLYDILGQNKSILFFRYSNYDSAAEFDDFIKIISKYTENFNIYVLSNSDTRQIYKSEKIVFQDFIDKDTNDSVCRKFFENEQVLNNFEKHVEYSSKQKEINLSIMNILLDFNKKYYLGLLDNSYTDLFHKGWGTAEKQGRWTVGQKSVLKLRSSNQIESCNIYFYFIKILTQSNFEILVNEKKVEYFLEKNKLSLSLLEINTSNINIEFIFSEKVFSPKDLGINTDSRALGIFLEYFEINGDIPCA